jgi:hypothetical protein
MRGNAFRPFGGNQQHRLAVVTGDENRHEADCFADDVIIDFPSVTPVVDRVRSAFLVEERPLPLVATIELTAREAGEGATRPLDVPVRCTCSACGGRGESWTEACARCVGSGIEIVRHQLQVTLPAGVSDGARFHFSVTPRHNPPTRIELHVLVS